MMFPGFWEWWDVNVFILDPPQAGPGILSAEKCAAL